MTIRRAKHEVKKLARQYYSDVKVHNYGAVKIDPKHLVIVIVTKADEQRDRLAQELLPYARLRSVLEQVSCPANAISGVYFCFQSQETDGRNWFQAMR